MHFSSPFPTRPRLAQFYKKSLFYLLKTRWNQLIFTQLHWWTIYVQSLSFYNTSTCHPFDYPQFHFQLPTHLPPSTQPFPNFHNWAHMECSMPTHRWHTKRPTNHHLLETCTNVFYKQPPSTPQLIEAFNRIGVTTTNLPHYL